MDHRGDHTVTPVKSAPSDRVGAVESGPGAGPLVRFECGGDVVGRGGGAQSQPGAPAIARVVLRSRSQAGRTPPSAGGGERLCAAVGLGAELVGGAATSPGRRCHGLGRTLCGAGRQRGLSRLCPSGRLDRAAGQHQTCRAGGVGADVAPVAARRAADPAGDSVGGPGGIRPLGVSAPRALGLASLFADQGGRDLSAPGPQPLPASAELYAAAGHPLAGGRGTAFVSCPCRLDCTRLACWEEGDKEPWFILTDLPPETSAACWYGLRAWIEQGFTTTKRGGWQWQRTRLTAPERAARRWLAVAVATVWLLSVGGAADQRIPPRTLLDLTAVLGQARHQRRATRLRLVSVFRQGWLAIVVALLNQRRLPLGCFMPEPWPSAEARGIQRGVIHEVPLAA